MKTVEDVVREIQKRQHYCRRYGGTMKGRADYPPSTSLQTLTGLLQWIREPKPPQRKKAR